MVLAALPYALVSVVFAYFLGAIPWAVVISRLFFKTDVREMGSGNSGTTNALRSFGWGIGFLVFLLDAAKGVLSVLFVRWITPATLDPNMITSMQVLAGVSAMLGHMFPIYLRFKGGKGVATLSGVILALTPWLFFIEAAGFILIAVTTRYVSVASMAFAVAYPILILVFHPGDVVLLIFGIVIAVVIVWMHRSNIARLRAGTENKLSFGRGDR